MARPKVGALYQRKNNPNWFFIKTGVGPIDTGTSDRFRAEQIFRSAQTRVGDPIETAEQSHLREGLDALAASLGSQTVSSPTQNMPINESEPSQPTNYAPLPIPKPLTVDPPKPAGSQVKANEVMTNFRSRFSPQKRERLFGALGSGCARVNAMAVEIGAGFAGYQLKTEYVFTPEDLEIIKTAFEIGLEELFLTSDPEWYHLLAVGNISLIVSMVPYLEKKEKVDTEVTDGK